MLKAKKIIKLIIKKSKEDSIIETSNALTYKLLLSLFPFLIFIMSLMGFFNLDTKFFLEKASESLPKEAMDIIFIFIKEVINQKNPSLVSTSLLITIFSASSGFDSIIRNINKSYDCKETRHPFFIKLISIAMVFIFTFIILGATVLFIFGDIIKNFLEQKNVSEIIIKYFFSFTTYVLTIIIIILITSIIYKLACCQKISFVSTLPGAVLTVTFWLISSTFFNIYISNFSKYSKIYGSIGSVFILMLWINIISFFLLVGSEINAIISLKMYKKL